MKLLQKHKDRGYPTEYLLSRIRGRRTFLLKDWNDKLMRSDLFEYLMQTKYGAFISEFSAEGVWKLLLKEYRWVYKQMNDSLRNIFQAFFEYTEIKILTACLRYKNAEGNKTGLNKLLSDSLLSDDIKQSIIGERGVSPLMEKLEQELPFIAGAEKSLKTVYAEEGIRGLEQTITNRYLEEVMRAGLHPLLLSFFVYLIDIKNIISLYKNLRWEIRAQPLFIQGGSIPVSQLSRAVHTNQISEISLLTRKISGQNIEEPSPSTLEPTLLSGLIRKTRKMSRKNYDIGILLDYLWRCNVEAQNVSILLHGRDMDRAALKEELVVQ